jgi:hypothetical protein
MCLLSFHAQEPKLATFLDWVRKQALRALKMCACASKE